MLSYLAESKHASALRYVMLPEPGRKNCPLFCGACVQPQTGQQGSRHSSLCMEQKQYSPPTSFMILRVAAYRDETADEARQFSVDLLEEASNLADQRSTIYQQKLRRYHSRRVRHRSFKEGDLVLRLKQEKGHKLEPPWEGPFVISKALHNGSYYLVDIREIKDRKDNFWNKRRREDPDDIYDESERPWTRAQLRPFHT